MKPLLSRRTWFKECLGAAGIWATAGGRLATYGAATLVGGETAAAAEPPRRFVLVHLNGAWNANLAVDPVWGGKLAAGFYDPAYRALETAVVPGKPALRVGPGFIPAMAGFAAVPTAFVNGLLMEVTAHDIASEIMLTGESGALRSDQPNASLTARMAAALGGFPAHVMLGGRLSVRGTRTTGPGLFASNVERLASLLRAPSSYYADATWAESRQLLATLDAGHRATLEQEAARFGDAWIAQRQRVLDRSLDQAAAIAMTSEVKTRYNVKDASSAAGLFAGAYLCLRGNLTRFVSITCFGFDTHADELTTQLPRQKAVSSALGQLLLDLATTPDPAYPDRLLSETTTVYVVSEFTRTPMFNAAGGTDHMPTASAIVAGRGVRDNTVIGATSEKGFALGWDGQKGVKLTTASRLLPKDLAATLLGHMGLTAEATSLSERTIDGLLV